MQFNQHSELEGRHAQIGASSYHWLNYSPEKMRSTYLNEQRRLEGTRIHAFVSEAIKLGIKAANLKKAVNMFINDAIGFKMHSEVVLMYSYNSFGTSDAISFRDNLLRIHDLKTGLGKPSFNQLNIYAALFCLEYHQDPSKIDIVERLYQGNGFTEYIPEPGEIAAVMDQLVLMDTTVGQVADEYFNTDF